MVQVLLYHPVLRFDALEWSRHYGMNLEQLWGIYCALRSRYRVPLNCKLGSIEVRTLGNTNVIAWNTGQFFRQPMYGWGMVFRRYFPRLGLVPSSSLIGWLWCLHFLRRHQHAVSCSILKVPVKFTVSLVCKRLSSRIHLDPSYLYPLCKGTDHTPPLAQWESPEVFKKRIIARRTSYTLHIPRSCVEILSSEQFVIM